MDDLLSISVNIADRSYKLKIKYEEEENLRKAVKLIEEQSKEYAKIYAYQDRQDLLAMVALGYVTSLVQLQGEARFKDDGLHDNLTDIDLFLSENLKDPD